MNSLVIFETGRNTIILGLERLGRIVEKATPKLEQKLKGLKFKEKPLKEDVFIKPTNSLNIEPQITFNEGKEFINLKGNLNGTFRKKAFSSVNEMKDEVLNHNGSGGIVGNLLHEWVEKIPKGDREKTIKGIYSSFKSSVNKFNQNLRELEIISSSGHFDDAVRINKNADFQNALQNFSRELDEILHNAGVVKESEKLNIDFLGSGVAGAGYHLKGIGDDQYVIKLFNGLTNGSHGKYAELNRAAYWEKHVGKTNPMAKFYFGDVDAGYMVNRYIGKETPECTKKLFLRIYGFNSKEMAVAASGKNKMRGYGIDFGGWKVVSQALNGNKTAQYVCEKICNLPEEKVLDEWKNFKWRNHLKLRKYNDDKGVAIGLASTIDLLPMESRVEGFKILMKNSDETIQNILANSIGILPENAKAECFKILAKNPVSTTKEILMDNIEYLPKEDLFECIKPLIENANKELKENLLYYIDNFAEHEQAEFLKKLAENGNKDFVSKKVMEVFQKEEQNKYLEMLEKCA